MRLVTDDADGHSGHGFVFTIGRGNDVQLAAIQSLTDYVVGRDVDELLGDLGGFWRPWSTTLSCDGSALRRASCTWPSARSSTGCGT